MIDGDWSVRHHEGEECDFCRKATGPVGLSVGNAPYIKGTFAPHSKTIGFAVDESLHDYLYYCCLACGAKHAPPYILLQAVLEEL